MIPNETMIIANQKKMFEAMADVENFNDPMIKELNNDLMNKGGISFSMNLDKTITKIEKYIDSLNQRTPEQILNKMKEIEPHIQSLNMLINEYKTFFNNLQNYKNIKEVKYALGPIYSRLNYLEKVAKELDDGKLGPFPQGSLCKKISWCEYALKGQYLESAGKEFFSEVMPQNIILETGSLMGQIDIDGVFKSGRKMKEDLMFLDSDNFKISFTIGSNQQKHTLSLQKFMEFLDKRTKTTSIHLTEEGYNALQQHLITAVQAKATRSNNIKFGSVNIKNNKGGIEEMALQILQDIYDEDRNIITKNGKTKKGSISTLKNQHADYDALFNYNLAHYINYIIGKNNKLLLTRNGLIDTYGFIIEQFNNKRFFKGNNFKLSSRAGIKVSLDFK